MAGVLLRHRDKRACLFKSSTFLWRALLSFKWFGNETNFVERVTFPMNKIEVPLKSFEWKVTQKEEEPWNVFTENFSSSSTVSYQPQRASKFDTIQHPLIQGDRHRCHCWQRLLVTLWMATIWLPGSHCPHCLMEADSNWHKSMNRN